MIMLLKRAVKLNLFNYLDIQFSIKIVEDENPILLLIFTLLSAEIREGHVCLFIDNLDSIDSFINKKSEIIFKLWQMAGFPSNNRIYTELKQSNAVSNKQQIVTKPLVLLNNKLYFQRMWADEGLVVDFFSHNLLNNINEQHLKIILTYFSSLSTLNMHFWQKIAIAVAVTSRISIISGGPGTGKTTIIAYLLSTLVKLSNKKLIIKLVTPTGKAAARLTESLNCILLKLNLSDFEKEFIPKQAQTIHSLLEAQLNSQFLRYNKNNQLLLDVLVIDEASMIDLYMMARIIEALPSHARIILLGDKDQLPSVEAGSVFSDLCYFAKYGYSNKRVLQLTKITGCDLSKFISNNGPEIKDIICLLRKRYRFNKQSEIGKLSIAINQDNIKYVEQLLKQKNKDIAFYSINSNDKYHKLLSDIAKYYYCYLDIIKTKGDPYKIITTFNRYRLLTALREGPYGSIELNNKLEQFLYSQGKIKYSIYEYNKNYEGRPIIITKNDYSLGLFNGDIGIILKDRKKKLKAYFKLHNGIIKKINLNCLPCHETVFAMTVHKSQGSEFEHISLVLPLIFTPIITKELIYTAITRAKYKLTIYSDSYIFIKALMTPIKRRSGLIDRLFLLK
ncbi:MAG: exodeoxyribonuclease V subunit alpha [Arsenophonus endosymbiont of Ceratovacuna japonica]